MAPYVMLALARVSPCLPIELRLMIIEYLWSCERHKVMTAIHFQWVGINK